MSRLPKPRSSPPPMPTMAPTFKASEVKTETVTISRKRTSEEMMAIDEDDGVDNDRTTTEKEPPRKIARPTKTPMPKPLTQPRPPVLSTSNLSKSTSSGTVPSTSRKPVSASSRPASAMSRPATGSGAAKRVVSGPSRVTGAKPPSSSGSGGIKVVSAGTGVRGVANDDALLDIQNRLATIEEARMRDNNEMKVLLEKEREKRRELEGAMGRNDIASKQTLDNTRNELDELRRKNRAEVMDLEMALRKREREFRDLEEDLRQTKNTFAAERDTTSSLQSQLRQCQEKSLGSESLVGALHTKISLLTHENSALQSILGERTLELESKTREVDEMQSGAREMEAVRRKLHNQVMELKGNIRVVTRVRPVLTSDAGADADLESLAAQFNFPDANTEGKELVVVGDGHMGLDAEGRERKGEWRFTFDKTFPPASTQENVFEELEALTTSVVDGYNVCVFAYGVTGSGKSYTMEGTSVTPGLIPRAVAHLFESIEGLREKGWAYEVEGSYLEIYNETIHDLLDARYASSVSSDGKGKYEIKHDAKSGTTRVTELTSVRLESGVQVKTLLSTAASRRTTAATLVNERSSRSHSVFTLRVVGKNELTGESTTAALNLVDLAGSERVNVSGTGGDASRLKETQCINKSLSALGDVIAALGERSSSPQNSGAGGANGGTGHVPYRNSKLTYLLQNSLGGNSKTLMVLNLSPLAAHLQESLTSLRFATKVNNTSVGTARSGKR